MPKYWCLYKIRITYFRNVIIRILHISSVASVVSVWNWAINDLLSRILLLSLEKDHWNTFDSSNSWKGITCQTASFILSRTNSTEWNPIDVNLKVLAESWIVDLVGLKSSQKHLNEFFFSVACELVDSLGIGLSQLAVMFIDFLNILSENIESVLILRWG